MAGMRLARALPQRLARDSQRIAYARDRLRRVGPALLDRAGAASALRAAQLENLSPLVILSRGYAVCFAADGSTVIKSSKDVQPGDGVVVRVDDGQIGASVTHLIQLEER